MYYNDAPWWCIGEKRLSLVPRWIIQIRTDTGNDFGNHRPADEIGFIRFRCVMFYSILVYCTIPYILLYRNIYIYIFGCVHIALHNTANSLYETMKYCVYTQQCWCVLQVVILCIYLLLLWKVIRVLIFFFFFIFAVFTGSSKFDVIYNNFTLLLKISEGIF